MCYTYVYNYEMEQEIGVQNRDNWGQFEYMGRSETYIYKYVLYVYM